jgi:hypothetical protein
MTKRTKTATTAPTRRCRAYAALDHGSGGDDRVSEGGSGGRSSGGDGSTCCGCRCCLVRAVCAVMAWVVLVVGVLWTARWSSRHASGGADIIRQLLPFCVNVGVGVRVSGISLCAVYFCLSGRSYYTDAARSGGEGESEGRNEHTLCRRGRLAVLSVISFAALGAVHLALAPLSAIHNAMPPHATVAEIGLGA